MANQEEYQPLCAAVVTDYSTVAQSLKAVSAYFTSKQIPHFYFFYSSII